MSLVVNAFFTQNSITLAIKTAVIFYGLATVVEQIAVIFAFSC